MSKNDQNEPIVEEQDGAAEEADQAATQSAAEVDEVAVVKDQLHRLAAEFDNYRRRTESERKQLIPMAQAKVLLELTPVLDNFRRATEHLPADLQGNNWVTGVLYVEKQLEQIFEQSGVLKIKTIGEQFDPKFHEAIGSEPSDQPADVIIAEVEGGYLLNGVVLKPARVKVSAGPEVSDKAKD
jgi:molecular chaperone GrpE